MSQPGRVDKQPGYILHTQPYRETSLLLEVLSRDHGRFSLVARSARRPRSDLRGVLLPFQPLTLSWFGKGELRTLHAADWDGGVRALTGLPLVCGFYLNELMMKLTARDDPEPRAFSVYDRAVRELAGGAPLSTALRRYELRLAQVLGYAPALSRDSRGEAIAADRHYLCRDAALPEPDEHPELAPVGRVVRLPGEALLALDADDYREPATRGHARLLSRVWLSALLGDEPLASRQLLQAIQSLSD
ncbi:DNA repair protein RecO [Chromobacterium violaceum]|uniref:DNA repair protein RecO n=2 Tax=Chromobacterium violaceum TaxID=536 RepID=RECO_CHRVO|nr:DNA repair protein RecO [Chromobacterium violaceum]Q7NWC1.1 RecName: Full=DNA repair protein RecO; AltName: Full=Recombination protein O [Chromobacterium violaceum ATCC 12472]AAQ59741.1 DNA repair protein [Chromobacterium violaceum ATCC 12472]KJH66262.1 DNA recombination protein RecO [Chromobacterium violaceum]MBA8736695.1 DNA repair protein RecO [Chromobacterium violaceum]MBP4045806.1 DNA repair protein RecO [Chromobacterium violaceum]MBT2869143.1 DNA repair protein RecO [Chromobacterium 